MLKKILIILLLFIPAIALADCQEVSGSRETLCYLEQAPPCKCSDTPCTYRHSWEKTRSYIRDGYSCRACAVNQSKVWMHNNGDGWQLGRCTYIPPPQLTDQQMTDEIVKLINLEKQRLLIPILRQSAKAHADYMKQTNNFSHYGFPGWVDDTDYEYSHISEIIFYGSGTPQVIVAGWMYSEGHKATILGNDTEFNCWYTRPFSVCHFGTPYNTPPPPDDPEPTPDPEPPLQCNYEQITTLVVSIQALLSQLISLLNNI